MVLTNNQRVFCNPVLVYAINVFVLHWIRAYDRPTCRYTWSTLAFASSFSSSDDRLNTHINTQVPPRKPLTISWSRSISNQGQDDDASKGNTDTPLPSNPGSIFDRWDDFQFSNTILDLRKKFQNEDLINLVRNPSSLYNLLEDYDPRGQNMKARRLIMFSENWKCPANAVDLDRFAKYFLVYTGYIVALRLVISIALFNDNILVKEVCRLVLI